LGITFNADEILEIACHIERNGELFYRRGAERTSDPDTADMLLELADMESDHLATFGTMRDDLPQDWMVSTAFDPDAESARYLQAVADGQVFDLSADASQLLASNESIEDILNEAIQAEKESVVFYSAMRSMVPQRLGVEKVDAIIEEEIGHIRILTERLERLNR